MKLEELKKQLSEDLLDEFSNNFRVYKEDTLDDVKEKISSLFDGIKIIDNEDFYIENEEELSKLIDSDIDFLWRSKIDNLDQDDLEFWGERFWSNLLSWARESKKWYDREKGSMYDDEDENSLYYKS